MSAAWALEWTLAFRRRRLLALNLLVPLLLVTPIALAGPPAAHASAVYAVLFVFFGVFGSAIPLVRDGSSGILTRWKLAGLGDRELMVGRLGAQASIDFLEALPAAAVVAATGPSPAARTLVLLLGALFFALLIGNALGAWAGAVARSMAESALFASVGSLLLLHGAGVFRTPAPGSLGALVERLSPFRTLHEALLEAAGGPPASPLLWRGAAASGCAFLVLTWMLSGTLLRSLQKGRDA